MAGDYISRDAAVKIAEKYGLADGSVLGRHTGLADCIASEISGLPAADVAEVAHAKWILDRYPCLPARECSRCTIMIPWMKQVPEQFWQYCPNCGARMDGAAE